MTGPGLRLIIFLVMITAFVSGKADIMLVAFLAAGAMIASRLHLAVRCRKSVDWPVLMAIAASFGVGKAPRAVRRGRLFAGHARRAHATLGPHRDDGRRSTSAPWSSTS